MSLSANLIEEAEGNSLSNATIERRRIDVTTMDASSVQEYVDERVDTDEVSLKHRGSRTYLVVDG